jgi:exosortase A
VKRDAIPLGVPCALEVSFAPAWRHALPALAMTLAVIVIAYGSTAFAMVDTWYRSATFTHGFVVVPIAAWLVWRRRAELAAIEPRPAPIVLPLFAALGILWLAGEFAAVNVLSQFAFVGMLVLAVIAILGLDIARTIAYPLGFLFFAVPFGDFLLPALMDRTADFTVAALRLTGVPVYREGLLIVLPTGRWSVVEACSGVRYLIASLMIGTLFAYISYRTIRRRLAFVVVSIIVPIVANWIRAYLIVLLGHLSNNRLAVGVDHLIYGWIFFGFVMLMMFSIGARWREPAEDSRGAAGFVQPFAASGGSRFWIVALAAICLAVVWRFVDHVMQVSSVDSQVSLALSPPTAWIAEPDTLVLVPHFHAPSATIHQTWRSRGEKASVFIAYYRGQTPERKAVSSDSPLTSEDDGRWIRTVRGTREAWIGDARHQIFQTRLNGGNLSLVAWQWYWVDGFVTSSAALAKTRIGWARLMHRRDDTAAIIVYALDGNGQDGVRVLERFTRETWPTIERALELAHGRTP